MIYKYRYGPWVALMYALATILTGILCLLLFPFGRGFTDLSMRIICSDAVYRMEKEIAKREKESTR